MKTVLAILALALAVYGCSDGRAVASTNPEISIGNKWYKTYDLEEGVVCYAFKGSSHRPANCLPINTNKNN